MASRQSPATPPSSPRRTALRALSTLAVTAVVLAAGCKTSAPAADDVSLARNIQAQLSADRAIAGQPIQTAVSAAVVTLTGSVANDAQRTLAARDAAGVPGVREVINNLTLATAPAIQAQAVAPLPPPLPVPTGRTAAPAKLAPAPRPQSTSKSTRQPAPVERPQQTYNPAQNNNPQQTYNPPAQQPAAPATPPSPSFRTVTVPSGNTLPVRITQTLDSATTQADSTFSGVVATDVVVDGLVAIPAGSPVSGRVDAVQEAAHFKGSSLLTVSLSSISRRGDRNVPITTEPYTVEGKGRGKNTAVKTGGGAAVGAILGGIFGGGKGAAIGAAAGGGVGAGSNAITRGDQVQIPSESVVRFRLAGPVTVRVRSDAAAPRDPGLERRPVDQ